VITQSSNIVGKPSSNFVGKPSSNTVDQPSNTIANPASNALASVLIRVSAYASSIDSVNLVNLSTRRSTGSGSIAAGSKVDVDTI
jgi:hypothetical protein